MRLSISNGLSISGQQTGSAGGGGGASAVSFGALTLAGAGGVAKPAGATNISDDGGTNLTLTSGFAVPATNGVTSGTVVWDDGTEWTVTAVANKYSCKADTTEIGAAWTAANTATATGILVRDGDATSSAMWTPAAKNFTNQFTIEPHSFTPAARPSSNTYTVHLPGLQFQVGTTNNVRLYGLDFFDDQTHGESESVGVIDSGTGGTAATLTNITVEACEVRSTPMTDSYDAGVFAGHPSFTAHASQSALFSAMSTRRGVRLGGGAIRVLDNYIHDVSRGFSGNGSTHGGTRSAITGNDILDVYTNFTTVGYPTNGLDIYDNRMMHAWGVGDDVPTPPSAQPHSSIGLSFDASSTAGQLTQDINVLGNIAHIGYRRRQYTEDSGHTYSATNSATGAKFNDPALDGSNAYSYFNITFAFNTLVTAGIGIEFSGADSIDIFNNTLAKDTLTASGSAPYLYFQGSANTRAWNNLAINKETLGSSDNTGFYVSTLADFEGYGNTLIYDETYFKVDAQTGYPEFAFADLETAFEPDTGAGALAATQKQGALGTGLYSGNGSHTVTYSPLTAAAGTAHTSNDTVWDGATRASLATGMSDGKQVSFVFEGKCGASTDGTLMYWYGSASNGFRIYRNTDNKVYISAKEGTATTIILDCGSDFTITEADGEFTLAIAVDLATGQVRMLKNGVPDRWMGNYDTITDQAMDLSASRRLLSNHTTGTGYWKGQVHAYWLTDEFIDFDIQSELNAVFTSTGAIKDPGATGSNYTGTAANVCLIGAASTYTTDANGGTGGAVAAEGGTVTDADTTAPTLSSPTDAANGATASTGSVSTDEGNGTLYWVVTTSATAPSAAQVKAGQDNGGSAATDSGSQAVSGTGVQTLSPAPSGLTASTSYTTHFMHEDSSGNQSAVSSASGFTTASAVNWVWPNGAYSTAAYTSLADATSLVVAFATRNRGARAGSTIPAVVGTSTDTRILINSSGSVEVRLENSAGTVIDTLSSGTTLSADNDIISVLLIVNAGGIDNGAGATGDTVQLWVNGVKTDSYTTGSFGNPKWPRNFQSSGSALYGDGDDSEYAMLWVGEYASGMGWSDFFDGSNLPQPSIGTVEGQAADFYEAGNAASWNAAMTLTGTFQDV